MNALNAFAKMLQISLAVEIVGVAAMFVLTYYAVPSVVSYALTHVGCFVVLMAGSIGILALTGVWNELYN